MIVFNSQSIQEHTACIAVKMNKILYFAINHTKSLLLSTTNQQPETNLPYSSKKKLIAHNIKLWSERFRAEQTNLI